MLLAIGWAWLNSSRPKMLMCSRNHLHRPLAKVVPALAAHGNDGNFPVAVLVQIILRGANQVGVERPAQAAVGGDQHQKLPSRWAARQAADGSGLLGARGHAGKQRHHLVGVRPRVEDAVLGAPQTRRRHHLHRPGNLLRALYRADAASNIK